MTVKQKMFVKKYVESNGNGTQAALEAYNTNNPSVAKVIASENLTKPNVKKAIELAFERAGLSDDYISELLREAIIAGIGEKATNADSLRGLEIMLKVKGAFPSATKQSAYVHFDFKERLSKMSYQELTEEYKKLMQQVKRLTEDIKE